MTSDLSKAEARELLPVLMETRVELVSEIRRAQTESTMAKPPQRRQLMDQIAAGCVRWEQAADAWDLCYSFAYPPHPRDLRCATLHSPACGR